MQEQSFFLFAHMRLVTLTFAERCCTLAAVVSRQRISMSTPPPPSSFIEEVNTKYEGLHRAFEEQARQYESPPIREPDSIAAPALALSLCAFALSLSLGVKLMITSPPAVLGHKDGTQRRLVYSRRFDEGVYPPRLRRHRPHRRPRRRQPRRRRPRHPRPRQSLWPLLRRCATATAAPAPDRHRRPRPPSAHPRRPRARWRPSSPPRRSWRRRGGTSPAPTSPRRRGPPSPSLSAPSVRLGSARRMASRVPSRAARASRLLHHGVRGCARPARKVHRDRGHARGRAQQDAARRGARRRLGRSHAWSAGARAFSDPSLSPSLRRLRRAVVGRPALEDARRRERGDAQGLLGGAALDWRVRDGERLRRARPRPQRDGARVLGRDVLLAPLSDSREESFCCRRDVLLQSGREDSERRVGTSFCRRASSATRTFTTTR